MAGTVDPRFGNVFQGRRVLVTGHTGFKGGWLSVWLNRLGAQVTGISLPTEPGPSFFDAHIRHVGKREDARDYWEGEER